MESQKEKRQGKSSTESRPIRPEDRRDAIEHALRRTEPGQALSVVAT